MKRRVLAVTFAVIATLVAVSPEWASGIPAGDPHVPDLITVAPFGFSLSGSKGGTTAQRRLYFSNRVANIGDGPLELRAVNNAATGLTDAFQEIYTHTDTPPPSSTSTTKVGGSSGSTAAKDEPTGSMTLVSTIPVGTFAFHPAHNHWHFQDFARYELRAIEPDGSTGAVLRVTDKVSFCILDTSVHITTIPHFGMGHSHGCGQTARQGLKVGYADTYVSTLPDQFIDITGLPDGTYRVVSVADPNTTERPAGRLTELSDANNAAAVDVTIAATSVSVVPGSAQVPYLG